MGMYDYDALGERLGDAMDLAHDVFSLCFYAADDDPQSRALWVMAYVRACKQLKRIVGADVDPFQDSIGEMPFGVLRLISRRERLGAIQFGPGLGCCWIEVAADCRRHALLTLEVAGLDPRTPDLWPADLEGLKPVFMQLLSPWSGFDKRKLVAEVNIEWCAAAANEADTLKENGEASGRGRSPNKASKPQLTKPGAKVQKAIELIEKGGYSDRQIIELSKIKGIGALTAIRSKLTCGKYDLSFQKSQTS